MDDDEPDEDKASTTARQLFGEELRRLRRAHATTQEHLAILVMHSRAVVVAVELGQRWPPRDFARRCDEVLATGGALSRLWPLVEAQRLADRQVLPGVRVADLREAVLRLAVAGGIDAFPHVDRGFGSAARLPDAGPTAGED